MKPSKKNSKPRSSANDPLEEDLSSWMKEADFHRVKFELRPKNKVISLRLNEDLLEAVNDQAEKEGLDYQKFIRLVLERAVTKTG